MNRRNYQKELEDMLARIDADGRVPTLLLHACCAPCSSYCLTVLAEHFHVTIYYYNPNITEQAEFDKRAEELKRLVRELPVKHPVTVVVPEYCPEEFYEVAKGLENEPERGARCEKCFRLRLEHTARAAAEMGAEYFATTLTISPQKDAELLNRIGEETAVELFRSPSEPKYLPSDFKKRNGYQESVRLSEVYGLYRQNYCGCIYSRRDALVRERNRDEQ